MERMYVQHPLNQCIFDVLKYSDIRCCNKNPTHLDFYEKPQAEGERGNPDFTIEFNSQHHRDLWFDQLSAEMNVTTLEPE